MSLVHTFIHLCTQVIFSLILDSEPHAPYYLTMITFLNHNITIIKISILCIFNVLLVITIKECKHFKLLTE